MSQLSEVSLGFAEFVSQLLEETFDATLSAQSHQNEKYDELISSLDLSVQEFYDAYVKDDQEDEKLSFDEIKTIVLARKNLLQALLQKSETPRLVVDSGEIRAKLELSNVFQEQAHNKGYQKSQLITATDGGGGSRQNKRSKARFTRKAAKIQKFHDAKSNKTTLLIDKDTIKKAPSIPGLRMAVTPASSSSSSSIYSEVIIRFKVV